MASAEVVEIAQKDPGTEKAVLACVLLDNSAISALGDASPEDLFTAPTNRVLCVAMKSLAGRGEAITYDTLRDELADHGNLELLLSIIRNLVEGAPDPAGAPRLVRRLKQKARRRRIARVAENLRKAAQGGSGDIDALMGQLVVAGAHDVGGDIDLERVDAGKYHMSVPHLGITFDVDYLRRERGQLLGELTVWSVLPGARTTAGGVLSSGSFNLSSTQTRRTHAKYLSKRARTKGDDIDWAGLLEEFCHGVLMAERKGDPAVDLRGVPLPPPDDEFRVLGLSIPRRHPCIVFGDGGSLKSLFALYGLGLLAQQGIKVALFDWEMDAQDHRLRLGQLFGHDMPQVHYKRCDLPLAQMIESVRRDIREHGIEFAIFDSVGVACDGPPESAEVATRYFQAIRRLGPIATMHTAHTTKSEGGDRKPFGSVYFHNSARATWFFKRADSGASRGQAAVGIYPRKANLGPLGQATGFEVAFESGRIHFSPTDVATVPDLSGQLSVRQRMAAILHHGAMTPEEIAEEIDAKLDTVKRTARRYSKQFTVIDGGRLGLLERSE